MDKYKRIFIIGHYERDDLYEQVASCSISSDNGAVDEHVLNIINIMDYQ